MEKETIPQEKIKHVWNLLSNHTKQPQQALTPTTTPSYWIGCLAAPIASSVVFPYAKQFGTSLAKSWGVRNPIAQQAIRYYFGITGLTTVSALGMTVCGKVFSQTSNIIQGMAGTHLESEPDKYSRTLQYGGLGLSIVAGAVSASQTSYLTLEYFQPRIGRYSIPLGIITQLTWTTIQAWSLYALPAYVFNDFKKKAEMSNNVESKRAKLLANLGETQHRSNYLTKASKKALNEILFGRSGQNHPLDINNIENRLNILFQTNNHENTFPANAKHSKQKKYIGWFGAAIGFLGSYFFYPLGRLSGESFAKLIKQPQSKLLPSVFSLSTFLCNAMLSAYATQDCCEKFYLNVSNLYKAPHSEISSYKSSGLTAILALSACAHRVSIAKRFVNPNRIFGFLSVTASFMSLFCINFWAIDSLKESLEDSLHPENAGLLKSNLNTVREAVTRMEEESIEVLHKHVLQQEALRAPPQKPR